MIRGRDIRRLRAALGLSMRELAIVLGVDPKTVYRWERADRVTSKGVQRWALSALAELADSAAARECGIEIGVVLATQGPRAAVERLVHMSMAHRDRAV